jgi:cation-transporting P-type ATPase F
MVSSPVDRSTELPWHQLAPADVEQYLNTDLAAGLSGAEVTQRHESAGFNELTGKKGNSQIVRFLMEFNKPLTYLLLLAGIVALFLRDWVDAGAIVAILFSIVLAY